jgi:hypothetical protein
MPLPRFAVATVVTATALGIGILSPPPPPLATTSAAETALLGVRQAQPPDYDGPPLDLFPCNEVYDGATMKWRGGWWKCEVVIDDDPKWQWEYWGNQDPNLA